LARQSHHGGSFAKVLDGHKQPIRDLGVRNDQVCARLSTVAEQGFGFNRAVPSSLNTKIPDSMPLIKNRPGQGVNPDVCNCRSLPAQLRAVIQPICERLKKFSHCDDQ